MANTVSYTVNYNDDRFKQVESSKNQALKELNNTFDTMVNQTDKYYQAQINASKDWAEKQTQLQQEQTDFAIEQIEQQKDQAKQDYTKEQSGAYVDWQQQSNQYGANAEQMAAQGMAGTGYSESSQVSMYNTYQNRVATARESYNRAVLNYDNAIKDARLQNNAALAEIAYQALQTQLELALEGFQYKNDLILEKTKTGLEVDNTYYNRYQDVLQQINTENAMEEEIRQFEKNYDLQVKEYEEGIRQFNEEIARLKAKDEQENKLAIQQLELQKAELEEDKRQFEASLAEEKRQFNASRSSSSSSSSSSKTSKDSGGSSGSSGNGKQEGTINNGSGGSNSAYEYLNKLIASGASKDKVANEIAIALRNKEITAKEATELRKIFTPRGLTY